MTKETVKSALTIDDTLLSRMLSVAETVPQAVLDAVGAAKGVGRDRWEELKKLVQIPANATKAVEFVGTEEFSARQAQSEGFQPAPRSSEITQEDQEASDCCDV